MKVRTILHRWKYAAVSLVILTQMIVSACASIPKDSVALSKEIGKGIAENQRAYISLLNRYFDQKKKQIDSAIIEDYLPSYISNLRKELRKAGKDPDSFDSKMLGDVVSDVIQKRDEMQAELEKTRVMLTERISGDQTLLLQANATLTGLLGSAADVQEATSSLGEVLVKHVKPDFDLEEFEKVFDEYLVKAGDAAAKTERLYDKVRSIINRGGN